ncbi:MAG: hypothetical protein PHW12_02410 [Smithella sp.]|nr:hypothetical protein [Smithella sp.]MDD5673087.1 hypothetical protein [Chitinivibrionales bacterium]
MSLESLQARLKDAGITDFTPQGLLEDAMKNGDETLIEAAKKLVASAELFENKKAKFLKDNAAAIEQIRQREEREHLLKVKKFKADHKTEKQVLI